MKHKYERVYVKVNANFDSTGYMQPRSIMWSDGRVFNIDKVAVSISTFTVSSYGQYYKKIDIFEFLW